MGTRIPLIAPRPARLSEQLDALQAIEASGVYSNGGPVVRGFEAAVVERMFGGRGEALAVNNATIGLMIAIREAAGERARENCLAIVPAITFAATAHAAEWAGLTPLVCDIDPQEWSLSAAGEEALLRRYGKRVAVIVPYATFGAAIDLERYGWLAEKYGVGVVVDAAASLGTVDMAGRGFATGTRFATVFSMHATKAFATAEGGLIYSADPRRIATLRRMSNFGFGADRSAEGAGLNAKLPEVLGLLAAAKLEGFESVSAHRAALYDAYVRELADFTFQRTTARRQAAQFMPVLLPDGLAAGRGEVIAKLSERGIGAGSYFSPHLGQQPHFRTSAIIEPTPVADAIGARLLSLPLTEPMTVEDVTEVCTALREVCATVGLDRLVASARPRDRHATVETLLVGGGPAGTAFLTAASKAGKLAALSAGGLTIVERGHVLGSGELGGYAITSDSTAETFLSAVKDNPHPEIAALADDATAQEIARYAGALGVPLTLAGAFLARLGAELGRVVVRGGGELIDGSEVIEAQRTASGAWRARVRDCANGVERLVTARNIVVATGGWQPEGDVAGAEVAGTPLGELAGERLVTSDAVLRLGGLEELRARLGELRAPRIAVVGASTSALATAALLLKAAPSLPLGPGAITLLHRQPLRPFYPSAEAARADGFADFAADDICPLSGFVYRLGGFRLEARELVLRMLEVGGRVRDPRLALHRLDDDHAAARRVLAEADVVIGALGYRPRGLTLRDASGARIALAADAAGRPRLADQHCRVIDAEGAVVPGAFGIGLAAGFVPWGRLGGEPSFRGKANGLWLWQNDVGAMIVDQIQGVAASASRTAIEAA